MKVVAFNGSPRKEGNTATLIKYVFEELEKEGIETELVHIGGKKTIGCTACMKCFQNKDMRCVFNDDFVNECIVKMVDADAIILASPTYFTDITTEMKALIDRAGFVSKANGDLFKRKVGASVVAVRRAGSLHAFTTMNNFFTISQMIIPGSTYWNIGVGGGPGDVQKDEEGIQTMQVLGRNMAWLLKKIHS